MRPEHRKLDKDYYRQCHNSQGQAKAQMVEDEAVELAALITFRHEKQVDAYQCDICKHWHIGRPDA